MATQYSFTLLCGYSAAHFTTPSARAALAGICDASALAKLPMENQKAFTQLWAEVAALLKKVEQEPK